jgi:D-3-phosphoglycerate dehydrogenase
LVQRFRIKILNSIAAEGLSLFGERYDVGPDQEDPHGIVVRSAQVDTGMYPSLLAVARAGAGINNITVDEATSQGICIFNTPGANANAVAELVFTMLGIGVRNIHLGMDFCRGLAGLADDEVFRQMEEKKASFRGIELAGKTLGVLGLGKIGVLVADGGVMRQMRVIGFDPFPVLENIHALSSEVTLVRSLRDVVLSADVLSLHMPLNAKTKGFVDAALIRQMVPGAILVNYARGPIVAEDAVLAALDKHRLGMYITDFPTGALLRHPRVIVSPHLGASTEESEEQCSCMAVKELKAYLEHGTVTRSVNFPTAETIPSDNVHTRLIMINRDIPGMIAFASHTIGSQGINIASYLNESNGNIGYNIIDCEDTIPDEIAARIAAHSDVIRTRLISYPAD